LIVVFRSLLASDLNAGANSSLILRCHERTMSAPILGRVDVGRIGTALLAALAVCILPVGTAHAQLFGPQYRSSWDSQVSFGHEHGHGNYHSVQAPHGNGNYRFIQAPTRERQLPFRSGTHKG